MSNLEDKLSASIQAPRRRATPNPAEEKGETPVGTTPSGARSHEPTDLNAGGGRGLNPPRIWPD